MLRADDGNGGVRGGLLAGQLEDADDARVIRRLDRRSVRRCARDRRGNPCGERLVERIVQSLGEVREAMVVAFEHRGDDLLVAAEHAAEGEHEKYETQDSKKECCNGQDDGGI